ncbi:hypothetical protein [Streptomyces sp. NPDC023588]|uniref:hypothetical protein n=1 Tax=Streptomyces sp. NPDC023588 TaxID=3154907 RepID=UPI0033E7DB9D
MLPIVVADEPTIRSVLAGADHVLGFFTLAGVLGHLHDREASAHGAADGHWRTDPHADTPGDHPATLTALISDWSLDEQQAFGGGENLTGPAVRCVRRLHRHHSGRVSSAKVCT